MLYLGPALYSASMLCVCVCVCVYVCVCSRKYICLDVAREECVDLFAHAEMYLSLLMAGIRSSCDKDW